MKRLGASLLVLGFLAPAAASAQPGRPPPMFPTAPGNAARPGARSPRDAGDLGRHFGIRVAEQLLASREADERLRGVQRLAAMDTPQALDLLIRSQEPGSSLSRDPRARLVAVRGLAEHLHQDEPRQVVVRALVDGATGAVGGDSPEMAALLRDTAAMALGRHGGARGSDALAGLLRQGGPVAEAAGRALLAYPPQRLDALAGGRSPGSVFLAELLASLGDLRAIPFLRRSLRGGDPQVRAASLVALAALGDGDAPLVARDWVREPEPTPRNAAIRALLRGSPAEGRAAIVPLLRDAASRRDALALALEGPGPELAAALAELTRDASLDAASRSVAIEALGRAGGADAAAALEALLAGPRPHEAALALATAPGPAARAALERALRSAGPRALALRASTARALALRDAPPGLAEAAEELWKSSTAADRAAAVFAWVALGKRGPTEDAFLTAELAPAAARGALARGPEALGELLAALERRPDAAGPLRDALALGLLARVDGGKLPSATLLRWVDEGSTAAPLAARALAARDDEALRERLAALLRGAPALRAHVALGLGRSSRPDAAGRLVDAYAFEASAPVRRAIVRALSWRTEPQRTAALELAAALDPDPTARSIARAALQGRPAAEQARGDLVAWSKIEGASGPTSLSWERPDGLALPVVSDADGSLLVPALPAAPSQVTLPQASLGSPRP